MERVLFLIFASLLFFASTTAMLDKDCEETASVQNCQEGYELVNSFMKERRCWINKCRKCPEIEIGCSFGSLGFERNSCTLRCKPHPCDVAKCPPGNGCRISYRTQNGTREYYSKCYVRDRFCFQPKSDGYCGQNVTRYYYNDDVKDCLPLQSSECGESKNNHASLDSCRKRCYGYRCRLLKCVACPNGYEYDDKDCQTCTCSRPYKVCPLYKCRVCEFGYKKDKYGCQTCDCLEPINSSTCIHQTCNKTCKYDAFVSDECLACECSEKNHCENVKCAPNHHCKIQKLCENGICRHDFQCFKNRVLTGCWFDAKVLTKWGRSGIIGGICILLTAVIMTILCIVRVSKRIRSRNEKHKKLDSSGVYKNLSNEIKVPLA